MYKSTGVPLGDWVDFSIDMHVLAGVPLGDWADLGHDLHVFAGALEQRNLFLYVTFDNFDAKCV